ncbi:MAG TPA: hypothetical protein PK282_07100, partial [Rhodoglobus sp.]|nr:hypothetical protein [Rhodoglobus sp.]
GDRPDGSGGVGECGSADSPGPVHGAVEQLNGPVDRPWGIRTAAFADPAGHVWEIAGPVAGA